MTVINLPTPTRITLADFSVKYSEDQIALDFSKRHVGDLRYCAQWGAWLEWDGTQWKFKKTHRAFDLSREIVREFAIKYDSEEPDAGKSLASAKTVAAVERLAR